MTLIVNVHSGNSPLFNTEVQGIGEAVHELAKQHAQGILVKDKAVEAIDLTHTGAGAPHIANIAKRMSITTVSGSGAGPWQHEGTVFNKSPMQLASAGINIKFVFESANEMIVVVRDNDALDYGLHTGTVVSANGAPPPDYDQAPPMNEPLYATSTPEARVFVEELVADALAGVPASPEKTAIEAALASGINSHFAGVDPIDVYNAQLGAYSVRQCS